jgi:tetratricopeptide (TPR) repeat protein
MERDHHNFRSALAWSLDNAVGIGVRLSAALGEFWISRAYYNEGREWLMKALAHSQASDPDLDLSRAKILEVAAAIAYKVGNFTVASGLLKESETLYQTLDDTAGLARVFCWQGMCIRYSSFDFASSRVLVEKSLALCRRIDDTHQLVTTLLDYTDVVIGLGDDEQAESSAKECLALAQSINDLSSVAVATIRLGQVAFVRKDYKTAQILYEKSLRLSQKIADKTLIGFSFLYLGNASYAQNLYEQAATCYAEALKIFYKINVEWVRLALEGAGFVSLRQQRWQEAYTHFAKGLTLCRERESLRGSASLLTGFAGVAEGRGQLARAAKLLGAVETNQTVTGWLTRLFYHEYKRIYASVRSTLGEEAFEAAADNGRDMTLDEAIAFTLEGWY